MFSLVLSMSRHMSMSLCSALVASFEFCLNLLFSCVGLSPVLMCNLSCIFLKLYSALYSYCYILAPLSLSLYYFCTVVVVLCDVALNLNLAIVRAIALVVACAVVCCSCVGCAHCWIAFRTALMDPALGLPAFV